MALFSLFLPLNYDENWLRAHISDYAGCNKPVAVLENQEAALAWFPIKWNLNHYQIGFLDDWEAENKKIVCDKYINRKAPAVFSLTCYNNEIKPIPYVLIIGDVENGPKKFPSYVEEILNNSYRIQQKNKFCSLYVLKNNNL